MKNWRADVAAAYERSAPSTEKFKVYHVTTKAQLASEKRRKNTNAAPNGCGEWQAPVYSRVVDRQTAHNRPEAFPDNTRKNPSEGIQPTKASRYGFLEYNPSFSEKCTHSTWAGYSNSQFPWVKAALTYRVMVDAPAYGAISLFKVPDDLPSGKYVLHWYWQKYVKCIDINVVDKSEKVTDVWGSPENTNLRPITRLDHCQTLRHQITQPDRRTIAYRQSYSKAKTRVLYKKAYGDSNMKDWGVFSTNCKIVSPGANAAAICNALCNRDRSEQCNSVNVVPWKHPATSDFFGQVNKMIPDECIPDNERDLKSISDNALVCYALKEGPQDNGGDAVAVTADPGGVADCWLLCGICL